jgi:hypothetical protein
MKQVLLDLGQLLRQTLACSISEDLSVQHREPELCRETLLHQPVSENQSRQNILSEIRFA